MPKVSIITAAYNHVRFIRQSVESAQAQSYRDFEHIVVDDGSSDGTADILKSFEDRITYIRQENRGAHAAINRGIRESSGEFIALLDSDDAWLPNKLELQIQTFEQFPEAGLVYSQAYRIDAEGNLQDNGEPFGRPTIDARATFDDLCKDNPIPTPTAMFRRACIEEVGSFSETLKALSDWDLWIRISAKWPVIFIPEPLALYRVHGRNSWDELVKNGRVHRERLLILANTSAELSENKKIMSAAFAEMALRTTYGFWYSHQYSQAIRYFIFALRLRPMMLKDGLVALKLHRLLLNEGRGIRSITRLLLGERGMEAMRSIRR